jgi:hypothetical protein
MERFDTDTRRFPTIIGELKQPPECGKASFQRDGLT